MPNSSKRRTSAPASVRGRLRAERKSPNDKPLAELAYDDLKDLLMTQKVLPGSILRESDLARDLGMSRTPVREALRRLQAESLLSYLSHVGYRVSDVDPATLEDLYLIRGVLEGLAARLAAQRSTRVDVAELDELLDRMARASAAGDDSLLADLNDRFHAQVAHASRSASLEALIHSIGDVFKRHRLAAIKNSARRKASLAEHRALAAAIARHADAVAEKTAEHHVGRALELRVANLGKGAASSEDGRNRAVRRAQ